MPAIPGGILSFLRLSGAEVGAASGLIFGALLMITERGRGLGNLHPSRGALWGALASIAPLYLSNGSMPILVGGAAIGAAIGTAVFSLAKHHTRAARVEIVDR